MREPPAGIVTDAPKASLPVQRASTVAVAALKVPCPGTNSGKGGVGAPAGWYGRHASPDIPTVPWPGPPQARIGFPALSARTAAIGRAVS